MPLALHNTTLILALTCGAVLGLAVFWIEKNAITRYANDTLATTRLIWVAPTLTVLLTLLVFGREPTVAQAFINSLLLAALTVLASIDSRFQLLPNALTLPLLGLALTLTALGLGLPWRSALGGALLGFLLLAAPGLLYQRWKKTEGVGWGDVKLTAAIGAWLGWESVVHIILVASLLAALFGIGSAWLRRQSMNQLLPFGPFVATATVIELLV